MRDSASNPDLRDFRNWRTFITDAKIIMKQFYLFIKTFYLLIKTILL